MTLTGPGGVGKTRLALEVARLRSTGDFADGAYFVSLASLRRPQEVAAAIVDALRIVVLPGSLLEEAVERFLGAGRGCRPRQLRAVLPAAMFVVDCWPAVLRSRCWPPAANRSALQAERRWPRVSA